MVHAEEEQIGIEQQAGVLDAPVEDPICAHLLEHGHLKPADLKRAEAYREQHGGDLITLLVRLQLPYVDPARCIGCGVCEHECPVKGRRAIRVTAENETRERRHRLLL